MPEAPFVPPPRKPVSEFPTPDHSVSFYTELVNRDDPAYKENAPVKRGTLYSTIVGAKQDVITLFPQLFFLRERKFQLSDQLVLWDWATDEEAHDTYNSTDTYVANNVNYPAFTRVYTIRRELYEATPTLDIGSPLPGIIAVTITDPGGGYTYATGTINDTSVAIDFTISPDGELLNGIITNTGDTVIADGTAILVNGDGLNGKARAEVQPTSCVLTAQKKEELADNDPLQHELVKVTRVYETLPGPFIYTTKPDKDGMLVTTGVRRNITANIVDGDVVAGGQWTQTWHKGDDSFVSEETVESRPIPGNAIFSTKVEEDGATLLEARQLIETTTGVTGDTLIAGVWTRKFVTEVDDSSLVKVHDASNLVSYQVVQTRPIPGDPLHSEHVDERNGIVIDIDRTLVDASTAVGGIIAGAYVEIKARDKLRSIQISSKLDPDSLPEDTQWYGAMQHSFPPELTDAIIEWAFAECGCSFSFSAVIIANLNQYSGMVKTRVTEQFYNGVPPDDVTITQFFPQTHHFGFAWASACGSTDTNCRTKSGSPEFHIPLCLHDDLSLSVGANVWTFAATSPAALPHGTYIMLAPHVERWRFGVFRRVLTEVFVP